jgi:ComF family protein
MVRLLRFLNFKNAWLEAGLGFLYPEICQICGATAATAAEGYVCASCWSRPGAVRFLVPPLCSRCGLPFPGEITAAFECANCRELELHFESARAAVAATGFILDIVHRYKYQRQLWFEPFLADLFLRRAVPALEGGAWDLIVAVPLHSVKMREREFNQAERFARRLSAAIGVPLGPGLLRRVLPTRTQTLLNRRERAVNIHGAFQYAGPEPLNGRRIILVDDVLTTGATTNECAKVLRQNGAGKVCVWTVARGLQTR